jgi:hypothetical protein
MGPARSAKPRDLDIYDPDFGRKMLAWASQVQCEMHELVLVTKETIVSTRIMIAEANRILAAKF